MALLELSVLDQSPIASGRTAADALNETVALAQLAERLGYTRYWLAEHHSTGSLAGSAPEIMITRVAAATHNIRVGSGGVMLSHYSPLKVAENFRMLHTLFPGRIDLGIGRAPGSDGRTAVALAQGQPKGIEHFPEQLADLADFLHDRLPAEHRYHGVRAMPQGPGAPETWLLGSSGQSAAYAAHFGFSFSFAQFISQMGSAEVLAGYRAYFKPSAELAAPRASLAVRALCADTEAEAKRLSLSFAYSRLRLETGNARGPVPTLEEAESYPYSPGERSRLAAINANAIIGAPEQVRSRLLAIAAEHGVSEVVVVTICHDAAARRHSYELLAQVMELEPRPDPAPSAVGG